MKDTKADFICDQIQKDLASGVFGQRSFLNVAELAEKYQVSKIPVRDALRILCEKGFLVSYPRRGYMVNYFSKEEVNKIQGVRRQLERYSVQLVIRGASDEEIASLRKYNKMDSQGGSNVQFHVGLAKLSGNEYLAEMVQTLVYKIAASGQNESFLSGKQMESGIFTDHEKIIDALLARDEEAAIREIENDIHFI